MKEIHPLLKLITPAAMVLALTACGSSSSTGQVLGSPSPTTSVAATPSPSPSPSPSPVASPSPAASPSPVGGSIDLASCPAYEAGQHPLGSPAAPGVGAHADATLDWTGCGTLMLPPGTTRFMTADNWQLGYAATCPNELDYGVGGMGPNVTFNEVLIDGTAGPDTESGAGPWTDSGGSVMQHGGNYQIRVTSIDPRCRWHVAIYSS